MHWSDPASVRFLEAALRALSDRAFLICAFARPELRESFPSLWSEREVTDIRLPKLRGRACEQLLDVIGGAELSVATRELVGRARRRQPLLPGGARARARGASSDQLSLPESILGIIQARLDVLGEEAKFVMRAASVFGESFRVEGLQALLGGDASPLDLSAWLQSV